MKERIVTGMWGDAWDRYGAKFLASFERHWPRDVELWIITDRILPTERAKIVMLPCLETYRMFMLRAKAAGRKAEGFDSGHHKLDADGRSWRHHALKWAPQGLAPHAAADGLENGDVLAWVDADVQTVRPVPSGWVGELLGDADIACLQRDRYHTEIGFWAARISAETNRMFNIFAGLYFSGAVFKLQESHSAFVFDTALESCPSLKIRNLNTSTVRGHPWPHTALARYLVHNKGKLKDIAK